MKVIMKNKRFWDWTDSADADRTLTINGTIAEESWFDDDVTPELFRNELTAGSGDITVWINSPGGDCIAAARIYNMLTEYSGRVTAVSYTHLDVYKRQGNMCTTKGKHLNKTEDLKNERENQSTD